MKCLFTLLCCLPGTLLAQLPPNSRVDTLRQAVFQKKVNLVRSTYGAAHPRFLVLHDDENTGVTAAMRYIGIYGGSLTALEYGGMRNITFRDSMNTYQVDPNNIFTYQGTRRWLDKSPAGLVTYTATSALLNLGVNILKFYNPDSLTYIITLHNNSENSFNVRSYLPGASRAHDAGKIHVSAYMDPDDMVIVTDMRFFEYLRAKDINVIYQSENGPDDGSLSVYATMHKIPYLNIEVQHGHVETQAMLITEVSAMLRAMKIIE